MLTMQELCDNAEARKVAHVSTQHRKDSLNLVLNDPSLTPEELKAIWKLWALDPTIGINSSILGCCQLLYFVADHDDLPIMLDDFDTESCVEKARHEVAKLSQAHRTLLAIAFSPHGKRVAGRYHTYLERVFAMLFD